MADENKQPEAPTTESGESTQTAAEAYHARRGVYLIPNLLTTTALFAGFYAIVAAIKGDFSNAAVAIFVAMIFDGLDGRVARMTHTQSDFGAQYDSMSDLVAFGVAPAVVAFLWSLDSLGNLGWAAAFVYVAGAALRLARFNTQISTTDKRFFVGLASPAAAAIVAGSVWAFSELNVEGTELAFLMVILVSAVGCLMVSNVRYWSFKEVGVKGRIPFTALLLIIMAFVVVALDPPVVLLLLAFAYAASGPIMEGWRKLKRRGGAAE
ncbi:CDP-diacylglycerol--serine O-phosphatidyltransferase [Salinispirillum sp. LH 10-3-1]|uniref:CDP-diacylglycerol--serine O-phosphatidyltransferase n=1 Tax=Salinispirillum sp. LH 10-3-1 TaxID=2952525 RepID=A0AB38YHQ5_9GAMM